MLFLLMQIFYYVIFRFFNQLLILHLNFVVIRRFITSEDVCWNIRNVKLKSFFRLSRTKSVYISLCLPPQFVFCFSLYVFVVVVVFFFGGGGQALLGERVKGQISRVIPAMVTSKWDWRQSSQSKNRTSYKPYTSPIFGKTSQSKGYLHLRSRDLVFFSPCLFFF